MCSCHPFRYELLALLDIGLDEVVVNFAHHVCIVVRQLDESLLVVLFQEVDKGLVL